MNLIYAKQQPATGHWILTTAFNPVAYVQGSEIAVDEASLCDHC